MGYRTITTTRSYFGLKKIETQFKINTHGFNNMIVDLLTFLKQPELSRSSRINNCMEEDKGRRDDMEFLTRKSSKKS